MAGFPFRLPDGFVLALFSAIFLAWLWPGPGTVEGVFTLSTFTHFGISLIFFTYGLELNREKLRLGLLHWKLNLFVQVCTFLLFPGLVFLTWKTVSFFGHGGDTALWLGVLYLASLPSTVTSSVVSVSMAKGNVPSAIFNASFSGLLGMVVTPLWVTLILSHTPAANMDIWVITGKLLVKTLVPVLIGTALNPWLDKWVTKHHKRILRFDQIVIILLVYTTFSESFSEGFVESVSWGTMAQLGGWLLVLLVVVYQLIGWLAQLLGMNREDRITALFCGSKKSLAHGVALSKILFAGAVLPAGGVSLLLLPLMMFHAIQLVVISTIAARYGQR